MTDAERKLWQHLRNNQAGAKIRRQVPIGSYILDFYCPKARVCVEVDGSQHAEQKGLIHDAERDKYLRDIGITVVRVSNHDVLMNTKGVLQMVFDVLNRRIEAETPPRSSPKRGGGA